MAQITISDVNFGDGIEVRTSPALNSDDTVVSEVAINCLYTQINIDGIGASSGTVNVKLRVHGQEVWHDCGLVVDLAALQPVIVEDSISGVMCIPTDVDSSWQVTIVSLRGN